MVGSFTLCNLGHTSINKHHPGIQQFVEWSTHVCYFSPIETKINRSNSKMCHMITDGHNWDHMTARGWYWAQGRSATDLKGTFKNHIYFQNTIWEKKTHQPTLECKNSSKQTCNQNNIRNYRIVTIVCWLFVLGFVECLYLVLLTVCTWFCHLCQVQTLTVLRI